MTVRAQQTMTGNERLVLTSGGGDSTHFFKRVLEQALKVPNQSSTGPRILIDQSAAPDRHTFDEQRDELQAFFVQSSGVIPEWVQPHYDTRPSDANLASQLSEAHLLYIDNGNARRFARSWPRWFSTQVTQRLRAGAMAGAGSGAGALQWCETGHSNARRHEVAPGTRWNYTLFKGLGVLPVMATTRWGETDELGRNRQTRFEEILSSHRKDWYTAIGMDSAAILVCQKGTLEVMKSRSKEQAVVHVYRDNPYEPTAYGPGQLFYP